jgi:replicative DNA helicase
MSGMTTPMQDAFTESKPRKDRAREPRKVDPAEVGRLFEKLPPHAIEAEMSVLGSMLIDPQVVGDVIQIIRSGEEFYKPANGALFDVIVELYDKHARLDIVTLNQTLVDRGILEAVGGEHYLLEIVESVPSAANADYYARLVREKAVVRRLIDESARIIQTAYQSPEKAEGILDEAERAIFAIAERFDSTQTTSLAEEFEKTVRFLEEGVVASGLSTGFADFDEMTGGLQNGELLILAARPSMGKTAFALNIALNLASRQTPVGVFSLEMSRSQLAHRLIGGRARVDVQRLRRNMLGGEDNQRVVQACLDLRSMPLYVDDSASITLMQLRAKARRMRARHDIKALIIDYLQLITVGGRVESRQIEVSEISRGLKALARDLHVPVVCLAQLNRGPENREGHRPRLSDLRESGSIEQDADVVMLLHREDYYHKEAEGYEPTNVTDLIIAKQRNGPTGAVRLVWDSRSTTFHDAALHDVPPGY